jgi:hypothetical protein
MLEWSPRGNEEVVPTAESLLARNLLNKDL